MTTRRGFLGAMLAAGIAPAFVKAEILMPVRKIIAAAPQIIMPAEAIIPAGLVLWGDGVTDDAAAIQAAIRGEHVVHPDGTSVLQSGVVVLANRTYRVSQTIRLRPNDTPIRASNCHFDGSGINDGAAVLHFEYGADATVVNSAVRGPQRFHEVTLPRPETPPLKRSRLLDAMLARASGA